MSKGLVRTNLLGLGWAGFMDARITTKASAFLCGSKWEQCLLVTDDTTNCALLGVKA